MPWATLEEQCPCSFPAGDSRTIAWWALQCGKITPCARWPVWGQQCAPAKQAKQAKQSKSSSLACYLVLSCLTSLACYLVLSCLTSYITEVGKSHHARAGQFGGSCSRVGQTPLRSCKASKASKAIKASSKQAKGPPTAIASPSSSARIVSFFPHCRTNCHCAQRVLCKTRRGCCLLLLTVQSPVLLTKSL